MAKARTRPPKHAHRAHVVRIGLREIETRGLAPAFWRDLYHRAMTVYWPVFFGTAALIFVLLNAAFAFLYSLGDQPVANLTGDRFLYLFFFSVETLATVGYGEMYPRTNYGHVVATIEIFSGMVFIAVMAGLIFARFSRPRARFVFARHPVVGVHDGQQTLMIRVANARHNTISQATARLWLFRLEDTKERQQFRRYYELKLERREHPMFSLSWTLLHVIDKTSPFHGISAEDFAAGEGALILNLDGVDDNSAQRLYARQIYTRQDIRWQHRYADITTVSDDGRLVLDYSRFHDVTPEEVR